MMLPEEGYVVVDDKHHPVMYTWAKNHNDSIVKFVGEQGGWLRFSHRGFYVQKVVLHAKLPEVSHEPRK